MHVLGGRLREKPAHKKQSRSESVFNPLVQRPLADAIYAKFDVATTWPQTQ
jgi:hypothetical protein